MAEQLICNQQVGGSTPFTSSKYPVAIVTGLSGGIPERPKGADCKSVVSDFGGPNPPAPTNKKTVHQDGFFVGAGSGRIRKPGPGAQRRGM